MKNKFKGFTLVELIVVMALVAIIMLGVMQLFKPIRTVYVDATRYEAQRTAQNGIVKYISESVRFSTDMGIYNKSVSSASDAASEFAKQYCIHNGIIDKTTESPIAPYDSTEVNNIKNEIRKYAEMIIIANNDDNAHTYGSHKYTGRLIRRKFPDTPSSTIPTDPALKTAAYTSDWRIAMGEAYYGENTFSINLSVKDADDDGVSDDGMLNVSVSSTRNGKRDISNYGKEETQSGTIKQESGEIKEEGQITRGGVLCRNLVSGGNGVNNAGLFDVSKYDGFSASTGKKTYIIFLNSDGKEKVDTIVDAAKNTP